MLDVLSKSAEQRRDPRKPVSWRVQGKWRSGKLFNSKTLNISKSGVMLVSDFPVNKGDRAYIKIQAHHRGQQILIDAVIEVMHQSLSGNSYNLGSRFLGLSDFTKKFISNFVSYQPPSKGRNAIPHPNEMKHISSQTIGQIPPESSDSEDVETSDAEEGDAIQLD